MNEKAENTRVLLIAQMRRAIELLEGDVMEVYGANFAEFDRKMHEIRRDSIRFVRELKPWTK